MSSLRSSLFLGCLNLAYAVSRHVFKGLSSSPLPFSHDLRAMSNAKSKHPRNVFLVLQPDLPSLMPVSPLDSEEGAGGWF